VGFTPQVADLDGDGLLDVISGSWPGEIYVFYGQGQGKFAPRQMLRDARGEVILLEAGMQATGNYFFVKGMAKIEKTKDGKTVVIRHGKRIEVPEGKQVALTGIASTAHLADWDGDGDLDLLVGEIGGSVYYLENRGTRTQPAFAPPEKLRVTAATKKDDARASLKRTIKAFFARAAAADETRGIRAPGGDAHPVAADWDGDGRLDLLLGCGDGSVRLYRNVGTRQKPRLAPAVALVSPGNWNSKAEQVGRGVRAKLCVADFNGDGRLDLLLGDVVSLRRRVQLTEEQKKLKQQLDKLNEQYQKLSRDYVKLFRKDAQQAQQFMQQKMMPLIQKIGRLRQQLPQEDQIAGHVWLFLRREVKKRP